MSDYDSQLDTRFEREADEDSKYSDWLECAELELVSEWADRRLGKIAWDTWFRTVTLNEATAFLKANWADTMTRFLEWVCDQGEYFKSFEAYCQTTWEDRERG